MTHKNVNRTGHIAYKLKAGAGLSALLLAGAVSLPAQAQDTGLETVTVTARYTQENLQTTPLAITAVTGDELVSAGVTNTSDLGAVVPNLFTHPGDAEEGPTPTITMRGVSAGDYSFARFPAVGIYVDDIYHSTMVGAGIDLNDVDRVEVKRGPQGTLNGMASIAGTISIYSKTPEGGDTGYFSAGYGSYDKMQLKGSFDTTIAPNLFLRVSGQSERQNGFVADLDFTCEMNKLGTPALAGTFPTADNSAYQRGCNIGAFGGTNISQEKVMLRYVASSRLEINWQASYYDEADEAPPEVLILTKPTANDGFDQVITTELQNAYGVTYDNRFLPPPGQPYSAYTTFCRPAAIVTPSFPVGAGGICFDNSQGQTSADTSAKVDYDITDKIHLKAIASYHQDSEKLHQAGDLSPLGYVQGQVFFQTQQWTGELRVNGTSLDDKLDWVGGLFFLGSRNHLYGAIDFVTENFTEFDWFQTQSQSGFIHANYKIDDRLSISAGARYSLGKNTASLTHIPLFNTTIPFAVHEARLDWSAAANYQVTDDIMAYVNVATGSRPPGITTIVNSIYQLTEYPQEKLISYEVGVKSEFFDHRLRINLDGFYMDYKSRLAGQSGYQCLTGPNSAGANGPGSFPIRQLTTAGCTGPGGVNYGYIGWGITTGTPAIVDGVELETTAEPIDRLLLNYSAGYNNVINGVKTPGQPGYVFPGNIATPNWNMDGSIQYGIDIGGAGMLTPRLDWVYETKSTYGLSTGAAAPGPQYIVPSHSVFNGQLSFEPTDSKWSAVLQVTNLANKYYFYELFTGSTVALAGNIAPPREYLITLKRSF